MASSPYRPDQFQLPDASPYKFAVVVSEWNDSVTGALYNGCYEILSEAGADEANVKRIDVPGSFELSFAAAIIAKSGEYDAIICLGCVIKGETKHDEYISHAVAHGLTNVSLQYDLPVIFGVLTTNNQQQAVERAGGKHGNKGKEAAVAALKMIRLKQNMQ